MATHAKYNIPVFWDDEFKKLNYVHESFNDPISVAKWVALGYSEKITGAMCDMRSPQPSWNDQFIQIYKEMGWKDIGTSYYRMETGTVMPTHSDLFVKYGSIDKAVYELSTSLLSSTDDFIVPSENKSLGLKAINFYPSKKLLRI